MSSDFENDNLTPWAPGMPFPWEGKTSIFDRMLEWDGESPFDLDEKPHSSGSISFGHGALDGIFSHHATPDNTGQSQRIELVIELLTELKRNPSEDTFARLYDIYLHAMVIADADPLSDALKRQTHFDLDDIQTIARRLLRDSAHSEPVKLGILLSGLCNYPGCEDDLRVLSRNGQFGLFTSVAAMRVSSDPVNALWKLARESVGWARIHAVERLVANFDSRAEIADWLLREGYSNDVMNEYLAYACATAGNMRKALEGEIDDGLLDGCCDIMLALVQGGPAKDLNYYADGAACSLLLLDHLQTRCINVKRLYIVERLAGWLLWPNSDTRYSRPEVDAGTRNAQIWKRREELGWTEEVKAAVTKQSEEILGRPEWPEMVIHSYENGEEAWYAWELAPRVGVDLWPTRFAHLQQNLWDNADYYHLLESKDADRVNAVIQLAETALPLAEIATGPADDNGFGALYNINSCLDFLLQKIARDNFYSDALVATGLRSPVIRHRNFAIRALLRHDSTHWGPMTIKALQQSLHDEPDNGRRRQLSEIASQLE